MTDFFAESVPPSYSATADVLVTRIMALIPTHPEIMTLSNPFDLFKVEGFECSDLEPSLAQAGFALREARKRYKAPPPSAPASSTPAGRDLILD